MHVFYVKTALVMVEDVLSTLKAKVIFLTDPQLLGCVYRQHQKLKHKDIMKNYTLN